MEKKIIKIVVFVILIISRFSQPASAELSRLPTEKGLRFASLPTQWDEGIPLGNGMLGALIYERDDMLRISLDRADLWDLRPVRNFNSPDFSYQWIYKHVLDKNYDPVHQMVDVPYDRDAAPTKIPAGALELPITGLGKIKSVILDIATATCHIQWLNGTTATFFISAVSHAGFFKFEKLPAGCDFSLRLKSPPYQVTEQNEEGNAVVGGQDLVRLGYPQGSIKQTGHLIHYHQRGWGDFSYDIAVKWRKKKLHTIEGTWSITSKGSPYPASEQADGIASSALTHSFDQAWNEHKKWWTVYWEQSSIQIPDSVLMHQYDMDMYLFASASRKGSPPITLQAIWTADNGKLPPWKGDIHNDLNTQLSYWPGYPSNHLQESAVFTEWLWKNKPVFKKYTSRFFKDNGLNVPGVCTLTGEPMGGWGQYSLSPTVACWLSQYFYWQWIYSGDKQFLKNRAYPWVKAVAVHIESIAVKDNSNHWRLPISSSPEFFDNKPKAWFLQTSNYDLSLIRWLLKSAIQMANILHLQSEATHWKHFLSGWPGLATNHKDSALVVAPGIPYNFSHRHFSHLMSIYPLQLVDWYHGKKDQKIIDASLKELEKYGPSGWTGYSYAWEACLKAMAQDGMGAEKALKIFATSFCSPNSFHLNGDQSGKGYSGFTYRPFTLEGNFAFAQAVQLMLLQQHEGVNYIFSAIPDTWKNVSFENFRTPGAFLISSKMVNGKITQLEITSLKGGRIKVINPFLHQKIKTEGVKLQPNVLNQKILTLTLSKGQNIKMTIRQEEVMRPQRNAGS